jgi:hypothetical protein
MGMSRIFVSGMFAGLTLMAAASDQHGTTAKWSDLPPAAQSAISAALGRDITAYTVHKGPGGLRTDNTPQHLRSRFTSSGVEMSSGPATWGMKLEAYGYGSALAPVAAGVPEGKGNRVEYRRGTLTESYVNGPVGLEQTFTISQPPGQSKGQELSLELALSGNLATIHDDQQVTLKDTAGESIFRYSGLQAHDSSGQELTARLDVQGDRILLRVKDRGARYPLTVGRWIQSAELTASDGGLGDQFGWSVGISGNTVVVGSPFHTVGLNLAQGAAYVFVEPANGWTNMTQTAELVASNGAASAFFGTSVAISGNTIIVGAGSTTVQGNAHQGAAYVFVEPSGGWTNMTQTAELTASDGFVGDDLGASVAISGNTVVAGAPYASIGSNFQQGAAYVFVEPSGGWKSMTQTAKLTSSDGAADDIFGDALAIAGNAIVIGASEASVSGNGNAGKAYVFVQPGSGWTNMTQTAELTASGAMADDYFGSSVAISGNSVVVGAPSDYSGASYVFAEPTGGWTDMTQTAELTPDSSESLLLMGTSVGISGSTVMSGAVGATINGNLYQGLMYMFVEPTGGWADENQSAQLTSSDGGAGDYFGRSLSMLSNAEAIGAPFHNVGLNLDEGVAYVFQLVNAAPTEISLSPNSANTGGPGFQLTVTGTNFVQGAVVDWADSPRSTTFVSSTELQAQILSSDIATAGSYNVKTTNPPPGGGNSNILTFAVNDPVPSIGSLSPDSALAGGSSFTLTVNGQNFVSKSKVYWNGAQLTTTFVSNVELQATVPAKDIAAAGTASVTVESPAPGGGTSNAKTFYINNPVPSLTSLNPSSIKAGSAAFTMEVYGSGFVTKSQVLWNGSSRVTTFNNSGKLQAKILKSDVAKAGTAQVTVSNPTPGGGKSNALTFTIKQ